MKKYIVTVYVKDNSKFGLGEKNIEFLVLGNSNPIDKVTNYMNNTSIQYFRVVAMRQVQKGVCLEEIYDILD